LSGPLPREERLLVEGRYRETSADWEETIRVYDRLYRFAPDNLEYGLALARVQRLAGKSAAARVTLDDLRKLPVPLSDDPRIDLSEAENAQDLEMTREAAARAAALARKQEARLFLARALLVQAHAFGELGRYKEATAAAQEARTIYTEAGDRGGVARALNRIAAVRPTQADYFAARALFEEAARISREIGDRRWTAFVLNNLALTYSNAGELAEARPFYDEALAISREIGARRPAAHILNNLGRDLNSMGKMLEGRKLLQESLETYRALGDSGNEVYALNNMGNGAMNLGNLDEAQRLYETGLPIARRSGDRRILAYSLFDLGDIQYWRGDLAAARKWYEESLSIRRKLELIVDAADTELMLARLALAEGDPRRAESLARKAHAAFEMEKSPTALWARAMVALALLDQRRSADATMVLGPAVAAAVHAQNAVIRLNVRVAEGRALTADRQYSEAVQALEAVVAEAGELGLVPEFFEARLALAQAMAQQSGAAAARAMLAALARDAAERGFGLIQRRAAAAE
jgi:tetratricopeptide (TPR) repeat protein